MNIRDDRRCLLLEKNKTVIQVKPSIFSLCGPFAKELLSFLQLVLRFVGGYQEEDVFPRSGEAGSQTPG